ncbi:hypothetical protein pdam_00009228 [Pocillopora damicornis]|uniref:Protein phosphatase 1 regulatory subunit 21 n=1 Tax=Pocillopora damicornis TaxID=46731 RepID=A0A3M6U9Z3_POCDA|nr:hypothetical protein pdam_00009228 [Pocillopora damicornis]
MSSDSQTLQAKYQKLAAEFAKQRAQNTVLKKAVIEEQEKTKTLQETLRQKDQSIRKYEQEIDSLQFRNDQLSKRVAVLQEELDDYDGKNRRGKSRIDGVTKGEDNFVKDQELQIKIQENERLQRELYETTQEHKGTILTLQEKLESIERLEDANNQNVLLITEEGLFSTRASEGWHSCAKNITVMSDNFLFLSDSHQQLKLLHREMTSRYDDVSKVVTEKLPFNDTSIRELNKLNVPTHDRRHQVKAKELICQAVELIRELVSGMSNFLTYTEQFCEYLHGNATVLRAVDQAFVSFYNSIKTDSLISLETIPGFYDFSEAFHKYSNYLKKLLPYFVLRKLITVFNKIDTYIGVLASASSGSEGILPANYNVSFMHLNSALQQLYECVKVLSTHFQSKVSLEHQLPTATQTLKSTDECIVSSLVSLLTASAKPSPESVPYRVALKNHKILLSSTESKDSLEQQISMTHEKLSKLEQAKEHWMLESQLLQVKHEKEVKKVRDLEEEISKLQTAKGVLPTVDGLSSISDETGSISSHSSLTSHSYEVQAPPSDLGGVALLSQAEGAEEVTRETLIKNHFTQRVAELTSQCRALYRRMKQAEKTKQELAKNLKTATSKVSQLEDEVETIKRSYETQLSMMSDHLCGMNEKLTSQQDEIEALKGSKAKKGKQR